jgi:hypothetical protein
MTSVLTAVAYLLPALALLAILAFRRYPGARALIATIERRRRDRRRTEPRTAAPRPEVRALLPRGGRLIACALAVRPPPAPRFGFS